MNVGDDRGAATLFAGPGAIRALCRSVDWSATSLGPVARWPESLRTVVGMCLDSRTPMAVWAGSDLTLIYNDGYPPVLGPKHPWALGRPGAEVWSEIWDRIGPDLDRVMGEGAAISYEDAAFELHRSGRAEQAFFTYSFTPVRDREGEIVAALNVFSETTARVQAETQREAFLSFALTTAHMGAWDLDLVDHTAHRSLEHDRIFGYEQLLPAWSYEAFLAHVLAEDRPDVDAKFRRAVESGGDWSFECRIRRRDGEVRWIWAAGRHRDDSRGHRRIAGVVQDITERRRVEEALAEASRRTDVDRSRLETVLEAIPSAVVLVEAAPPHQLTYVNGRATELYGVDYTGCNLDAHTARVRALRADGTPFPVEQMPVSRTLMLGQRVRNQEMLIERPDGVRLPVVVSSVPLFDAAGDVTTAIVVFDDITEQKQNEEMLLLSQSRLEQERARLQTIIDTIPVGLRIVEPGGEVAVANDEGDRIWAGEAPIESVRRRADEYKGYWPQTGERLRPDEWPAARALLHGISTRGAVVDIERFDGSRGTILASGAPIRDDSGRTVAAVVAIQDITALREAQERLEDADRRKNQFLAILSHELRNPLTPVRNSLYILERAAPGGDQARRARDIIERQIDQLSHLVDDLLDVTRITRGMIQLQPRRLELNELVRRTIEDHRSLLEKSGVEVQLDAAEREVVVYADWNRVAQVIGNLLQNAGKFTPPGGRVTVTVRAEPSGQALVRVADTGAGIDPQTLPRLFEPFMQADTTLDRSKGGLGLGLALVKGLVEQHGGSVEARSAGLGRGAEFSIRLPLRAREPSISEGQASVAAPARRRVLVIEDNRDAADSLRDVLELSGHEVAVAYDGIRGLERAREFRPEIVLCDIGLPEMDGYAVARAFRADEALRPVRLVALSGYALPEDLARAAAAGFERHLAKPPSFEKLAEVLAG